jgi:uncharacterized membrane protein (DUF106 family)
MKPDEFKKILKPLIKQTIKEVLLEEGVLSKVVSEVAAGLNHTLVEAQKVSRQTPESSEDKKEKEELYEKQRQERIKRLNESSGLGAQVFNGISELTESDSKSPLSGVHAADAGVDISAIEKLSNGKWKTLVGGK